MAAESHRSGFTAQRFLSQHEHSDRVNLVSLPSLLRFDWPTPRPTHPANSRYSMYYGGERIELSFDRSAGYSFLKRLA
jgi:hypothetical protein